MRLVFNTLLVSISAAVLAGCGGSFTQQDFTRIMGVDLPSSATISRVENRGEKGRIIYVKLSKRDFSEFSNRAAPEYKNWCPVKEAGIEAAGRWLEPGKELKGIY